MTRWLRNCALAISAMSMAGCVGPEIDYGEVRAVPVERVNASDSYRFNAGDSFEVLFAYHPTHNASLTVRPDGKVTMGFAQEVQAAGVSVAELDAELTRRVSEHLKDPELTVVVRTHARQKIFLGGEVQRPGQIDLVHGMTLYQAIAAAGWFSNSAAEDSVILLRSTEPGKRQVTKVDLSEEALLASDAQLQPFDIIYVPRTSIARVGVWVDEHINNIIPQRVRVSLVSYSVAGTTNAF